MPWSRPSEEVDGASEGCMVLVLGDGAVSSTDVDASVRNAERRLRALSTRAAAGAPADNPAPIAGTCSPPGIPS